MNGLFPATMLPDMIAPFLEGGSGEQWLVAELGGAVAGFLYSAPEMLTDGTHNLRAMATAESARATGIGTALIGELEKRLATDGQRVLLVETSSTDTFAPTRSFYTNRGFTEEARIRGFWAEGDDKVIFWKAIPRSSGD